MSPAIDEFLSSALGEPARVIGSRQLTGGASRATWLLDVETGRGHQRLVLRADMGGVIHDQALSREQEYRVIEAAHRAGVLVPRPRGLCLDPAVPWAPFFLVDFVAGESVGRRVVREPALAAARPLLPRQMGEQLARIHAVDLAGLDFLPRPEGTSPALAALEASGRQLDRIDEPHPVLELARRWLARHAPACDERVLCHGDFRVGNLMVGEDGLKAVFDWEFAHVGDPAEELAWPMVRSWRFGADRLRLGGVGSPDEFLDAYTAASGRDRAGLEGRLRFWEVMGNFRWAVGCLVQARRHLDGQAVSVELASLGRRAAEVEWELLELIGAG